MIKSMNALALLCIVGMITPNIVLGQAANGLMAVNDLIYDKKKLTWKELKAALAANFEGE